jgi:hypothetical protein
LAHEQFARGEQEAQTLAFIGFDMDGPIQPGLDRQGDEVGILAVGLTDEALANAFMRRVSIQTAGRPL